MEARPSFEGRALTNPPSRAAHRGGRTLRSPRVLDGESAVLAYPNLWETLEPTSAPRLRRVVDGQATGRSAEDLLLEAADTRLDARPAELLLDSFTCVCTMRMSPFSSGEVGPTCSLPHPS